MSERLTPWLNMVPTLIFQLLMHFSHPQRMYVGRFLSCLHGVVTALAVSSHDVMILGHFLKF